MFSFKIAKKEDLILVHQIAKNTWFKTYKSFISKAQIDFMFEKMYAIEALEQQLIFENNNFIIAFIDNKPCGFLSYKIIKDEPIIKLPKLYVLPNTHGKKIGSSLINQLAEIARKNNKCFIELNVNRNNPALLFYLKLGFSIIDTIDIPYYDFVLNDYLLQKVVP